MERDAQDGKGSVVVPRSRSACGRTFWIEPGTRYGRLWVDGWRGTLSSDATRLPGLVAATDVADAVRGKDSLEPGGHADLAKLADRLGGVADARIRARVALAAILLLLALLAPRRALVAGPAAVTAALLLSALGWTSAALFAALTVAGSFAPRRALWGFFAGYFVLLVVSPETQSLALLGPHPDNGGRFYGVTNELETLLLAPALLLGVASALLVVPLVAWSRAGADGGGALVFLSAYAWLAAPRERLRGSLWLLVAAAGVVVLGLALVGLDAATGGSSHVTATVGDGPGAVWDAFARRWSASWRDATATPARTALDVVLLGALVWVAVRSPRHRLRDAFLVGIAVSLVVNDTPHESFCGARCRLWR